VALLEAAQHPPSRTATPNAEHETVDTHEEGAIKGIPSTTNMTGSYHFMQDSELEPTTPFDEGAEWVEHPEATAMHQAPEVEPTTETSQEKGDGHIDWAAEDHGDALPSISGLQEQFGTSGQATPIAETPVTEFPIDNSGGWEDTADPSKQMKQEESDGFTTIPTKRGGDWRGGDRGRGRGGYRGRSNGGDWRSGSGSGNWNNRENRGDSGGEGSGRSGYRGGGGGDRGRGEFRGRARGEWRGGGEWRGRGGGERGRGEGHGGW